MNQMKGGGIGLGMGIVLASTILFPTQAFALWEGTAKGLIRLFFITTDQVQQIQRSTSENPEAWLGE